MAGIRKKLKAIKKRLCRLVSKTPKRKFYYGFFSKYCRLRPKWVLIESFHGQTVSDSGLVLAQEIARLYPGQYRVFYATEDKKKHQAFVDAAGLQVELVDVTTFRYTRILACAQHIFSNASLPIYFIKRPGQVYMQTWHGTPLKTLGKQMRMGIESMYNVQHNFLQADYLTQPNAFTRDVILRDYNLEPLYTGKVVIVDDYFRLLNMVDKRPEVKLMQLWHACGAFKTFGFTRLGKAGGPKQTDPNHRMYDVAIVSSAEIAKHYAEGFGLSDDKVLATGIPRTDIFMDPQYAQTVQDRFYAKYPQLRDKRIILFAPTFRGNGQMSAYYPADAFHVDEFMEALPADTALLIKYHPFCPERPVIPEGYKDRVLDLSDEDELNDLLFVTDLLITDYSSVVFEASLLDIPMLFYAFDLFDYISKRDFYYDFESFVPGKIVFSQRELTEAIVAGDFESEKVPPFKTKFFDHLDGRSSRRVADLILRFIGEKE